jgi:hypothetical protein
LKTWLMIMRPSFSPPLQWDLMILALVVAARSIRSVVG